MSGSPDSVLDYLHELERIVKRIQQIQRDIKASRQPPSMMELEELKSLGREYGRIIDRLANPPGDTAHV
jgi:hypothetical protein